VKYQKLKETIWRFKEWVSCCAWQLLCGWENTLVSDLKKCPQNLCKLSTDFWQFCQIWKLCKKIEHRFGTHLLPVVHVVPPYLYKEPSQVPDRLESRVGRRRTNQLWRRKFEICKYGLLYDLQRNCWGIQLKLWVSVQCEFCSI